MTVITDGPILTLAGSAPERAVLRVPSRGAWSLDLDLIDAPDVSGAVQVACGATTLEGTIVARADGVFALQRRTRIVGGAGGWGKQLAARSYHADNGVSRSLVLGDLSADAGELLDLTTVPSGAPLNVDYVRAVGLATRTLEEVGGSAWYVGFDGITKIGERATVDASSSIFEVLEYDPRTRVALLGVDAIDSIQVGSIINDPRLPSPQTVRAMEIEIGQRIVARAWCGAAGADRIEAALEQIIATNGDQRALAIESYRVVGIQGDRVELRPSDSQAGLPAIQPISMYPGVAGAFSEVTVGIEVLVAFVAGKRDRPVVIGFGSKADGSFTPMNTTIDVSALLKLGANAVQFVALAGDTKARLDTLQNAHDTHTHQYLPGPGAATPTGPAVPLAGPLGPIAATKVQAE